MRLITFNVAGRVAKLAEQAGAVATVGADVVCLQEITSRTAPQWRAALGDAGYAHVVTTLDPPFAAAQAPEPRPDRRRLGVLTATRAPQERLDAPALPWPERVLVTRTGGVQVINVHSPIAPVPDLAKVRTHEAVAAFLAGGSGPRVLCGDLNTPRREHPDGDVMTFAYTSAGKLREERGERWDVAERALVHGLRQAGWTDAFRALHGYEHREPSWTFPHGGGWRLDHVLVDGLTPTAAAYAHDWRTQGLSDHSALVVDLSR